MRAAEDSARSHTRDVKGLNEKVWEEALPPRAESDKKKSKKAKAPKVSNAVAASA
jgi:hypothetical protein